jgi:diguanylate cyclase (GGDEF)-like protein
MHEAHELRRATDQGERSIPPSELALANFRPTPQQFESVEEQLAYYAAYIKGSQAGNLAAVQDMVKTHLEREEQLQKTALTDAKTGLLNAQGLAVAFEDLKNAGRDSSVLFIDLDKFKDINESLGHAKADLLLNVLGQFIAGGLRDTDILGRHGGDEFVAILPDATVEDAATVAERIGASVTAITAIENTPVSPTMSIGVAHTPAEASYEQMIEAGDTAMYQAKAAGRDMVVILDQQAA